MTVSSFDDLFYLQIQSNIAVLLIFSVALQVQVRKKAKASRVNLAKKGSLKVFPRRFS